MARPRIIKIDDKKEITLTNFTPEEADALTEHINKAFGEQSTERGPAPVVPVEQLTNVALGLYKVGKEYFVATLKFDPVSQACGIEKTENVGDFKAQGIGEFRKRVAISGMMDI